MIMIPYNTKAGYDMSLFNVSTKDTGSFIASQRRIEELNKQGPKGWKLVELEG